MKSLQKIKRGEIEERNQTTKMGNTSSSRIQKKITNVKRYKMLKEKEINQGA